MVAVSILINAAYLDPHKKPGKSYAIEYIPPGDSIQSINVNLYGVFLVKRVLDTIMFRGVNLALLIWAT